MRHQLDQLRSAPVETQISQGYLHTSREIGQQPEVWDLTAQQVCAAMRVWRDLLAGVKGIVLTGSGSSHYVGEGIACAVQEGTGIPTSAIQSGELLLLASKGLPPLRPLLVVSFARSGDSPESSGLIRQLLEEETEVRHLVLTCNRQGRLAGAWGPDGAQPDPRVQVFVLDERTCDQSLVMTSSYTSLAVAGLGLAFASRPAAYLAAVQTLARSGAELLSGGVDSVAEAAAGDFRRMIVLGSGPLLGAARETALKMVEMTDGRVFTVAESTLGFRHGPMCALRDDTLLVVFLSSDGLRLAYQTDLLREINRKSLGGRKLIVGSRVPRDVLAEGDIAVQLPGLAQLDDEWTGIAGVVVGQLLGFFRCLAEGLQPDQPALAGSISRVVGEFTLHAR